MLNPACNYFHEPTCKGVEIKWCQNNKRIASSLKGESDQTVFLENCKYFVTDFQAKTALKCSWNVSNTFSTSLSQYNRIVIVLMILQYIVVSASVIPLSSFSYRKSTFSFQDDKFGIKIQSAHKSTMTYVVNFGSNEREFRKISYAFSTVQFTKS